MTKYLLVKSPGGGGIGDCIKAVLVAALYARLSGRVLVVDWSGSLYAVSGENVFADLFVIHDLDVQQAIPKSDDIFPPAWRGRLTQSLHEVYTTDAWDEWDRKKVIDTYSFDLSCFDYANQVLVMWEFDQLTKLIPKLNQSLAIDLPSQLEVYRYLWQSHFRLAKSLQIRVSEVANQFNPPMLGVHVRASQEFIEQKGEVFLEQYYRELSKLHSKHPIAGVFLATDNRSVEHEFTSRYSNVVTINKWFAEQGQSLHLNSACPDKSAGVIDAMLDVALLAKCDYLIYNPASSFSQMAAILSGSDITHLKPVTTPNTLWSRFRNKYLSLS